MQLPGPLSARHIPGLSFLLLLMLTTVAAGPVRLAPSTGRVTGHVRGHDGAPIANAQVFVVGTALSSLTDSKGAYAIPDEVVPIGATPLAVSGDSLTYQQVTLRRSAARTAELLTVRLRYKKPTGLGSRLLSVPVVDRGGRRSSDDLRFAAAVAAFAMVLRNSEYKGSSNYHLVLALARGARGEDDNGYRQEFISMVERARALNTGGDTALE